jgi:leucyl aminopeptidase
LEFKIQATGAPGLCGLVTDALLVVLCGDAPPAELEAPLAEVLAAAIKDGDFACKPGQSLYAHRVTGVKASRVMFVHAGDGSLKSWRKAVSLGVAHLKAGGSKTLAVAAAGGAELSAAHAEALVLAAEDAVYLYRATKPSAAPAQASTM